MESILIDRNNPLSNELNNKPQLKKENSYAWLNYVVPEIFAGGNLINGGVHLDHI